MVDQRVGSLATINSVGQVAEVVLISLKLGYALLVRHIAAHLDELGAQHIIFLVDFGVCQFIFGDG